SIKRVLLLTIYIISYTICLSILTNDQILSNISINQLVFLNLKTPKNMLKFIKLFSWGWFKKSTPKKPTVVRPALADSRDLASNVYLDSFIHDSQLSTDQARIEIFANKKQFH